MVCTSQPAQVTVTSRLCRAPPVTVVDEALLLRALEVYEVNRLDFAQAYLVACAEVSGVGAVASFDRAVSRVPTVRHIVPGRAS